MPSFISVLLQLSGSTGTPIDVSDYEYRMEASTVVLTKYIGANSTVKVPTIEQE